MTMTIATRSYEYEHTALLRYPYCYYGGWPCDYVAQSRVSAHLVQLRRRNDNHRFAAPVCDVLRETVRKQKAINRDLIWWIKRALQEMRADGHHGSEGRP